MKKILIYVSLLSVCFIASPGYSDNILTLEIDGKINCCSSYEVNKKECLSAASAIKLSPGRYRITPKSGAISKYSSDRNAVKQKRGPWSWFIIMDVNDKEYMMGSEEFYETPEIALETNQSDEIKIELNTQSTAYFWIEDMWKNKNTCYDNRGTITISIEKM